MKFVKWNSLVVLPNFSNNYNLRIFALVVFEIIRLYFYMLRSEEKGSEQSVPGSL
jgi:hypothetical protein